METRSHRKFPNKKKCGKIASNQRMSERTSERIQRYVYLRKIISYRCCFLAIFFSPLPSSVCVRARLHSLMAPRFVCRYPRALFSPFHSPARSIRVYECVALNAIASRFSYLVVTLHKNEQATDLYDNYRVERCGRATRDRE